MTGLLITLDDLDSVTTLPDAQAFCFERGFNAELQGLFIEHWRTHQRAKAQCDQLVAGYLESSSALIESTERWDHSFIVLKEAARQLVSTSEQAKRAAKSVIDSTVQLALEVERLLIAQAALSEGTHRAVEALDDAGKKVYRLKSEFDISPSRYSEFST
jgi:hypothetical protein